MVQELGSRWGEVLERHDEILTAAIGNNRGTVVKTDGDSFFAVFEVAADAVAAAVEAQRTLAAGPFPEDAPVKVRMGLHTGLGALGGSDYIGLDVHRAARISAAAHGGQVVLSETTAILIERGLPDDLTLHDLGKHRLKDLSDPEAILQVSVSGLPTDFPVLRTLDAIPNNLPAQLTSFVGRERELAEAVRLLEGSRILTLTGPGGTGKTRLALQLAAEVSDHFDDGVFFVDLSPVTDVEVVPSAILNAVGLAASAKDQSPEERLLEQLRPLNVLLVLDNFEHVLGAAPVVSALTRTAARAKMVATSRAPLRITGEQELPVPPLVTSWTGDPKGAMASEGVQLLVERAMAVRPDFRVTPENVATVVELVNRLDGLPLAIELVASRLRLLPVETIVQRLDTRMLSSGSVDLPERQRTIHNTIAWSYDLLDPGLRTLLTRLAVFSGGARLEEIEALFADWDPGFDLLDGLGRLVDNSLVSGGGTLGEPWFRILHVIREFAAERLVEAGESERAHLAHLRVYLDLARKAEPQLLRKERLHWFDLLEGNHDNIRTALEWGVDHGETDLVLDLAATVWRFWQARGHLHEAQRRIEEALALPGGDPALRAKAIEALGGIFWWRGMMAECVEAYSEALEMQRGLGSGRDLARSLYNYGLASGYETQDFDSAEKLFAEAQAIFEAHGDEDGLGDLAWGWGNMRTFLDRDQEAYQYFVEAADHYRSSGNEFGVGWSLFEAAYLKARGGQPFDADDHLKEALRLFSSHRDVSGVVMILFQMAGVALDLGDRRRAFRLAGVVDSLRHSSGVGIVGIDINAVEGLDLERLDELAGDEAEALTDGRAMTLDQAVSYALAGPTDDGPPVGGRVEP